MYVCMYVYVYIYIYIYIITMHSPWTGVVRLPEAAHFQRPPSSRPGQKLYFV